MTPEQAVVAGYQVIQGNPDLIPRGTAYLLQVDSTSGVLVGVHPLDFITLAFPDLLDSLSRRIGWILGRTLDKLDAIEARL